MKVPTLKLTYGDRLKATIFKARGKELSRSELQRVLRPHIAACLRTVCRWKPDHWMIGDFRFGIFLLKAAPGVEVFVQFWSEPAEIACWEVCSGSRDRKVAKWLAGDRAHRLENFGFTIGGGAGNYEQHIAVHSAADVTRIAGKVVDIFYTAFDYRGREPVRVQLAYDTRATARATYQAFTPEDLAKILDMCGYTVGEIAGDDDAPVLRTMCGGIETTVTMIDRVEGQRLYRRAMLSTIVPDAALLPDVRSGIAEVSGSPSDEPRLGTMLIFDGGVTVDWVRCRLHEWSDMSQDYSKRARRRRRGSRRRHGPTIH